jgi:hypothetical protein
MAVSTAVAGDTALYVSGSMKTVEQAVTYQSGKSVLTGSFYHDADSNDPLKRHAFTVDASGWGTSTGTVIFKDAPASLPGSRYIRTEDEADMTTFNRGESYVAFPAIRIDTNDTIQIPGRMGLDADSISLVSGKMGHLYLHSDTASAQVYDASLRIS